MRISKWRHRVTWFRVKGVPNYLLLTSSRNKTSCRRAIHWVIFVPIWIGAFLRSPDMDQIV